MAVSVEATPAGKETIEKDKALFESVRSSSEQTTTDGKTAEATRKIVWRNVFIFIALHLSAVYGFYLMVMRAKWATVFWIFFLYVSGALGITAGAHRLWAHRTYKAKLPLRALLMLLNTLAFQNDVIEWARDHRCHHKWSETDADPHNAKRGFFFSHMGWLLMRKHPEVIRKGKTIDLADLYADPVLTFQRKYYPYLVIAICFLLPTAIPVALWGETWRAAYFTALWRYALTLNVTWSVNSFAHLYGRRPYDPTINPRQNYPVALSAMGEGFHNFHHMFPQDYKTSEYPWILNFSTVFIDLCALFGLAYDLKMTDPKKIRERISRNLQKSE